MHFIISLIAIIAMAIGQCHQPSKSCSDVAVDCDPRRVIINVVVIMIIIFIINLAKVVIMIIIFIIILAKVKRM